MNIPPKVLSPDIRMLSYKIKLAMPPTHSDETECYIGLLKLAHDHGWMLDDISQIDMRIEKLVYSVPKDHWVRTRFTRND